MHILHALKFTLSGGFRLDSRRISHMENEFPGTVSKIGHKGAACSPLLALKDMAYVHAVLSQTV